MQKKSLKKFCTSKISFTFAYSLTIKLYKKMKKVRLFLLALATVSFMSFYACNSTSEEATEEATEEAVSEEATTDEAATTEEATTEEATEETKAE